MPKYKRRVRGLVAASVSCVHLQQCKVCTPLGLQPYSQCEARYLPRVCDVLFTQHLVLPATSGHETRWPPRTPRLYQPCGHARCLELCCICTDPHVHASVPGQSRGPYGTPFSVTWRRLLPPRPFGQQLSRLNPSTDPNRLTAGTPLYGAPVADTRCARSRGTLAAMHPARCRSTRRDGIPSERPRQT